MTNPGEPMDGRPLPNEPHPSPNFKLADAFRNPEDREKPYGQRLEELIRDAKEDR